MGWRVRDIIKLMMIMMAVLRLAHLNQKEGPLKAECLLDRDEKMSGEEFSQVGF